MAHPEPKICATCGRRFEWRRAWAEVWDEVRYCSKRCRAEKPSAVDDALTQTIMELALQRGRSKTLCPSEAAKVVGGESWRPLMERTRRAARRLVAAGTLEILQKGRVVDPSTAKGPIRLRVSNAGRDAATAKTSL